MRLTPKFFENLRSNLHGQYVLLGGSKVYYETYGRGEPLFWLHGGLSCIDGLRFQTPFFARYFKVILPERSGHGHSPDIAGPYSYEAMAEQTLLLMKKLKIKKASFAGYSDGANLLLWLAAKYPARVKKIILVGSNFHSRGCESFFQSDLKKQNLKKLEVDPRYERYSPDGKAHYVQVYQKCRKLWLTEPKWKVSLLKKIQCPTLIAVGDRDMIKLEHTLEMFKNIKKSELAVIPGASHSVLKEKPELINPVMLNFLKR